MASLVTALRRSLQLRREGDSAGSDGVASSSRRSEKSTTSKWSLRRSRSKSKGKSGGRDSSEKENGGRAAKKAGGVLAVSVSDLSHSMTYSASLESGAWMQILTQEERMEAREAFERLAAARKADDMLALFDVADAICEAVMDGKSTKRLATRLVNEHLRAGAAQQVDIAADLRDRFLATSVIDVSNVELAQDVRILAWRALEGLANGGGAVSPFGFDDSALVRRYVLLTRMRLANGSAARPLSPSSRA